MATDTNIFPAQPNSYNPNYYIQDPTSGWSVSGDNNPSTCIGTSGDSKFIYVNLYVSGATENAPFSSFDISSIPVGATINSLTMYWAESRSGTGAGSWKGQHSLDGSSWTDNIAAHTIANQTSSGSMSRPGGGSWTRSDLSNLQVRCSPTNWGSQSRDCTIDYWYVTVNWDYGTKMVIFLDD